MYLFEHTLHENAIVLASRLDLEREHSPLVPKLTLEGVRVQYVMLKAVVHF